MDALTQSVTELSGSVGAFMNELRKADNRIRNLEQINTQQAAPVVIPLRGPSTEDDLKEIGRLPDSVKELQVFEGDPTQYVSWIHTVEGILDDYKIVRCKPIFRAILGKDKNSNVSFTPLEGFTSVPLPTTLEETLRACRTCPASSSDAIELTNWSDNLFASMYAPQAPLGIFSANQRKLANYRLIQFFCGQTSMYKKVFTDMKVVILSMPSPSDINKLLFDEIAGSESSKENLGELKETQIVKSPKPKLSDYVVAKVQTPENVIQGGLADDVKDNEDPYQGEEPTYDAGAITNFWDKLHERIGLLSNT